MTTDPKKRGLGRGLDALFRDVKSEAAPAGVTAAAATAAAATAAIIAPAAAGNKIKRADEIVAASASLAAGARKVAVERLIPGKFQPRRHFDEGAISQLADSIAVHGVVQPLLVRPLPNGSFEIIAGERRWRAAQKAQLHEVPVVIQELTDKAALEIALIENLQREDLSAIEEAEGYQRLMDEFSHTQEMLSQQLGKSRSHVANTLRLLKLPAPVRKLVQEGALSAGHARTLVNAKDPEHLADVILKRHLSVRQAEKLVQEAGEGKAKAKLKKTKGFVQKDVDILALEQKVTGQLGMRVTIDGSPAGRLSVDYKSLDQLEDVLKRLSRTPDRK